MSFLKNRTVLGVICILLSLVICFAVTPLFNSGKSPIVNSGILFTSFTYWCWYTRHLIKVKNAKPVC